MGDEEVKKIEEALNRHPPLNLTRFSVSSKKT